MRLIDADKLKIRETWALVENVSDTKTYDMGIVPKGISFAPLSCVLKKDIDDALTIDAVGEEIIRCPDCKYYHKRWHSDKRMKEKGYWCCWCDCHDDWVGGKDGFCSLAERKEDETN